MPTVTSPVYAVSKLSVTLEGLVPRPLILKRVALVELEESSVVAVSVLLIDTEPAADTLVI